MSALRGSFGFLFLATGLCAASACGSTAATSRDFGRAPAPDAGPQADATVAFGDTGGGGQGGSAVCAPAIGNYEVPNNGCDDDADGQIDNVVACDDGLPLTGNAAAFAKALGVCQVADGPTDKKWGVISAVYARGYNQNAPPADEQHGILGKFGTVVRPREGSALGVLSTGWAREFNNGGNDDFKGTADAMTDLGAVPPGYPKAAQGCEVESDVHDVASVRLTIKVPDNAEGVTFDFNFHSGEWPEFVCTSYNDGFIAYLGSAAFNGGKPENISFDAQKNPVSVNNGFFDRCTPNTETGCAGANTKQAQCAAGESELAGTGFGVQGDFCGTKQSSGGGATGWLTSGAPVKPGEVITVEFMIWDTGDASYDSSVLLDHLTWSPTPLPTKTDRPK